MAQPPIGQVTKRNACRNRSATARNTRSACATTSGPIPSPGSKTILASISPRCSFALFQDAGSEVCVTAPRGARTSGHALQRSNEYSQTASENDCPSRISATPSTISVSGKPSCLSLSSISGGLPLGQC